MAFVSETEREREQNRTEQNRQKRKETNRKKKPKTGKRAQDAGRGS